MLYFFILGNNPTLSIVEIFSRLGAEVRPSRIGAETMFKKVGPLQISQEVLLLEMPMPINAEVLMSQLGGTIKVGEAVEARPQPYLSIFLHSKLILKLLPQRDKVYFGFSVYKLEDSVSLKKFLPEIKKLAMKVKRALREKGVRTRWVTSRERTLSSVVVRKNKLLSQGAEIVFLVAKDKYYLGKILAVQEFEEYSFRDWQRPEKRIGAGMLPPKLAKIMINLAVVRSQLTKLVGYDLTKTLLDPFCGSGTILQEAVLLGYKNLIGSDISKEAVEATKKNLNWLIKEEVRPHLRCFAEEVEPLRHIKIFQSDVRELSKKLKTNSIDAIVTEPYLGPPKIPKSKTRIKMIIDNLSLLYLAAFREFKKILKENGKIVIIFPVFKMGLQLADIPILDEIKKLGYKIEVPIPKKLRKHPVIKISSRGSIIYSRPDQRILREIFVFKQQI